MEQWGDTLCTFGGNYNFFVFPSFSQFNYFFNFFSLEMSSYMDVCHVHWNEEFWMKCVYENILPLLLPCYTHGTYGLILRPLALGHVGHIDVMPLAVCVGHFWLILLWFIVRVPYHLTMITCGSYWRRWREEFSTFRTSFLPTVRIFSAEWSKSIRRKDSLLVSFDEFIYCTWKIYNPISK